MDRKLSESTGVRLPPIDLCPCARGGGPGVRPAPDLVSSGLEVPPPLQPLNIPVGSALISRSTFSKSGVGAGGGYGGIIGRIRVFTRGGKADIHKS